MSQSAVSEPLITIQEFRKREPHVAASDARIYQMAREGLLGAAAVHLGRRIFIDPVAWSEHRRRGGQACAGGWKKKVSE